MAAGILGEIDKRRDDFNSDDRTSYDAFAALFESFTGQRLIADILHFLLHRIVKTSIAGENP